MSRAIAKKIDTIPVKKLYQFYHDKKEKAVPMLNKNYDYLSPQQYSNIVGISAQTITAMCRGGGVEGAIKINNQWRIPIRRE